jgi:hypothetical protein
MIILYPSSLPRPQTSIVTPFERRALSQADRPRDARAFQRDRLDYERITWPTLSAVQVEALMSWWEEDLVFGGAWFTARWPLPRGFVEAVRKFREQPKREYAGRGFWRASAVCEVRGRTINEIYDIGTELVELPPIGWSIDIVDNDIKLEMNAGRLPFGGTVSGYTGFIQSGIFGGTVDETNATFSLVWTPSSAPPAPPITPTGEVPTLGVATASTFELVFPEDYTNDYARVTHAGTAVVSAVRADSQLSKNKLRAVVTIENDGFGGYQSFIDWGPIYG